MDSGPLDYASPRSTRIKGAPTPEQIQFRRRMRSGLLIAIILGFIPYPTQILPTINLQLVDPGGKPVTDVVSFRWQGYSNGETLEDHVQFDMSAKASVSRQRIWSSPFGRVAHFLSAFLPHSGGFGPSASGDIEFNVPSEYALDGPAMGLIQDKSWSTFQSDWWRIPQTGDFVIFTQTGIGTDQTIWVRLSDPGKWGRTPYNLKIVLKRKPTSATMPSNGNQPKN